MSLKEAIPPLSKIGYLPVINGSPTQLKTVNAVFQTSLAIADELDLDAITLVFDLAFYAKAQQVRWYNKLYNDRTVVSRFRLSEILTEADVIAQGSIESVMKGKHYSRRSRVLKIMTEALRRLQLEEFLASLDDTENGQFEALSQRLREAIPQSEFMDVVHAEVS